MAKAMDLSPSTVGRVWRAHGLKPHLMRTFKVSNDPRFAEKLADIVGLYLDAPEHAIVLCCDEKSQVQALDRTQPGLPLKKGRAGRKSRIIHVRELWQWTEAREGHFAMLQRRGLTGGSIRMKVSALTDGAG